MDKLKARIIISALLFSSIASAEPFTVFTANLYAGNNNAVPVSKELACLYSDVLILLEWNGQNANKQLLARYNFVVDYPQRNTHGIAIAVKNKHAATGSLVENSVKSPCAMPYGSTSLILDGKRITVLAIHIPPPIHVCDDATQISIEAIHGWVSEGRLSRDIGTGKKEDIVVIAGDFNSFSSSKAIKGLAKVGLVDAHKESANIVGGTWSPLRFIPKLARIDYVFVSKHLQLIRSETFGINGSDHKGVLAIMETK